MLNYTPFAEFLFVAGRVIFGGYFLWNGLNHFLKNEMLANYAASKNVPMPKLAVYLSGLMIFLGGLGIIIGYYVDWSAALIALFLFVVTFKMHNFWADQDPNMKMSNMVNFAKNLALLGASLIFISQASLWIQPLFNLK